MEQNGAKTVKMSANESNGVVAAHPAPAALFDQRCLKIDVDAQAARVRRNAELTRRTTERCTGPDGGFALGDADGPDANVRIARGNLGEEGARFGLLERNRDDQAGGPVPYWAVALLAGGALADDIRRAEQIAEATI